MPRPSTRQVLRFIAANVRRLRVRAELTQEELAEDADLATRFLQEIEAGSVNLSVDALVKLSGALKVAPTVLFKKAALAPVVPGRPRKRAVRRA